MSFAARSFYEELVSLEREAVPFVLVTLVESLGSVPQDTGAKMLVTEQGLHVGTVGGGRVEARAMAFAQEILAMSDLAQQPPRFVNWSLKGDVGMTCGGSVKFYFEPHPRNAWPIAIFGAGHIAQALVPVLLPLRCSLTCFDSRAEWLARLTPHRQLKLVHQANLGDAVETLRPATFILCMTQGHQTDRPILERALGPKRFRFIGAIGSGAKATILRRELIAAGISAERAAELHCPLGLPFGSNHPHEIALSIAAQLLVERDKKRDEVGLPN